MTQSNSHTYSSETSFSKLLSQVVLLLLGTPPVLRPVVQGVQVVVGNRIQMGGFNHAYA